MFVVLSSNMLSIIKDTLKVQCLSKCKMHCLLWRNIWMRMRRAGHVQKNTHTHIYMDTDTDMCITMSMMNYIHRGLPLTEAIHEYDSDMHQNEPFQ